MELKLFSGSEANKFDLWHVARKIFPPLPHGSQTDRRTRLLKVVPYDSRSHCRGFWTFLLSYCRSSGIDCNVYNDFKIVIFHFIQCFFVWELLHIVLLWNLAKTYADVETLLKELGEVAPANTGLRWIKWNLLALIEGRPFRSLTCCWITTAAALLSLICSPSPSSLLRCGGAGVSRSHLDSN